MEKMQIQMSLHNDTSSVGRYLEAPLNPQGRCPGPLLMKHSVKVKNTRFTLRSRLSKKNSKSHLINWIAGEDAFLHSMCYEEVSTW